MQLNSDVLVENKTYFMVCTLILTFNNILRHLIIIFVMLNYFCCIKFHSSATIKVYNSKEYFLLGYQSKCDITFTMETYFCNFFIFVLCNILRPFHNINDIIYEHDPTNVEKSQVIRWFKSKT